jgi:hypothetical protein
MELKKCIKYIVKCPERYNKSFEIQEKTLNFLLNIRMGPIS